MECIADCDLDRIINPVPVEHASSRIDGVDDV